MRHFVVIFSLVALLSSCTSIINEVTIEPFTPESTGRTIGADIDDTKMTTFIGVNLKKADPQLDKAHINVSVFNGLVLLTGEVSSTTLKTLAGDVAREYNGVRQVYNELQIRGNTSIISRTNDTLISGKVKTKLAFNKEVDYSDLTLITEDSIVYLLGTVSKSSGDLAAEIASNTSGVRKVVKCLEYVD
ncbi:BON domain-containing protein [Gammaproteobacteria bacterium]|nr:BON domain-containing protein [Gammaproteobacteria bacterium]|tara:strand:- start:4441 stop:5007 length:567 start_codon:yes stop_codon:yes gene_type:complete